MLKCKRSSIFDSLLKNSLLVSLIIKRMIYKGLNASPEKYWQMFVEDSLTMHCSYILNSVRFRTDSNSVRKTNLKKCDKIFQTELDSVRK